jgi:hypothetical protein
MTNEPAAPTAPVPTAPDMQMIDAGNHYQVSSTYLSYVEYYYTTAVALVLTLTLTLEIQSDTTASSSSSDAPPSPETGAGAAAAAAAVAITTPPPCALLESLTHSYDPDTDTDGADGLQTSCGEYLELIFIHREAFAALPSAHVGCSAGFSALARALELRAWRADRDADSEAVAAFRHEAWMVAAWMSSGGPWWRGGEKITVD